MNDLLNEDEFLPQPYNPNKWFMRYYIVAFVFEVFTYILFKFILIQNNALSISLGILTGFIIPFGMALTMVFAKKEVLLDTKKSKIALGIFTLLLCFYIPRIAGITYTYITIYLVEGVGDIFLTLLVPLAVVAILYGLILAVTLPLVSRSRKIRKRILSMQGADKKTSNI